MKTKHPNFLDALPTVLYADDVVGELAVRGAKGTLSTEERDALLAKCSTGEYVELFIDILAFEQTPKPNRNAIRFADDALDELAASTRDLVKKNPAIAVGAATVIGFVLARLLKGNSND